MKHKVLTPEVLAKILQRSAQIKEESFDHTGADRAEKQRAYVDYNQFYITTLKQAIQQATKEFKVDPRFSHYIYLSFHWCNDIHDWANNTLDGSVKRIDREKKGDT